MTDRELERRYIEMRLTYKNLVNANIELVDENNKLKEENEKLNNIINLMSDFLVKHIANGGLDFMYRLGFKDSYKKLQELKGSDKE